MITFTVYMLTVFSLASAAIWYNDLLASRCLREAKLQMYRDHLRKCETYKIIPAAPGSQHEPA